MRGSGLVAQKSSAPLLFGDLSGDIHVSQDEYKLKWFSGRKPVCSAASLLDKAPTK